MCLCLKIIYGCTVCRPTFRRLEVAQRSIHCSHERAWTGVYQGQCILGYFPITALVQAAKAGTEAIVAAHDLLDVAIRRHKHRAVITVRGSEHLGPAGAQTVRRRDSECLHASIRHCQQSVSTLSRCHDKGPQSSQKSATCSTFLSKCCLSLLGELE